MYSIYTSLARIGHTSSDTQLNSCIFFMELSFSCNIWQHLNMRSSDDNWEKMPEFDRDGWSSVEVIQGKTKTNFSTNLFWIFLILQSTRDKVIDLDQFLVFSHFDKIKCFISLSKSTQGHQELEQREREGERMWFDLNISRNVKFTIRCLCLSCLLDTFPSLRAFDSTTCHSRKPHRRLKNSHKFSKLLGPLVVSNPIGKAPRLLIFCHRFAI